MADKFVLKLGMAESVLENGGRSESFPYNQLEEFKEGWKNYHDITNPWMHAHPLVSLGRESVELSEMDDPHDYFFAWTNLRDIETASHSSKTVQDRMEILKGLNANMAGFAMAALAHQDIEVAVHGIDIAGVLENPAVSLTMWHFYLQADGEMQKRLIEAYRVAKNEAVLDAVASG